MSRLHRLLVTDRAFFVTVNLHRTRPAFCDEEYPLIVRVLDDSRRRLKFLLCGYVLMPDHWHALIWPRPPMSISRVLHDVKKISALRLHATRGTEGPFWQHQFWDRFVRDAREYNARLDYMHLNPVRKGLVKRPQDWPWSSYNNYSLDRAKGAVCPIQMDYVRVPEAYGG